MKEIQKVEGKKKRDVMLYALSTCIWCRKTKKLLEELEVEYNYIDMDLVEDDIERKYTEEMKKWNPDCSFPTLIIDKKRCIVGFQEDEIRKEFS